jgi:glycosyltransferase involved in cell wall biosynthesis
MQIAIARTMPHFSMDVYANGLISGFKTVRPNWQITELAPHAFDRHSRSLMVRAQKSYERFWRFPRTVQHQSADVYHIIDHSDAHIVRWLRRKGKPVVVTCHDLINFLYPENLKTSVRLPIISDSLWRSAVQSMQYADAIVAVSSATAKDIVEILNIEESRIVVAPNAVEPVFRQLPEAQAQSFREQLNVPKDTICLLNVGSNHPRKNLSTVLKALHILKQQDLSVQLWKVSDDFGDENKNFIQAHHLESCIRYLKDLDKPTLVAAYNAADILIAPSFHEGFGLTLLEAMACGTPVITSNTSAMPEVVGDAGILVDPKDCQAIADAVCCLQRDSAYYQKLKEKGLKRSQLFRWEKTAEQIAELYTSLLTQKTSQAPKKMISVK